MRTINVFHIVAFVGLGAAACNGALVVDGKPSSDQSAEDGRWTANPSDCPTDVPETGAACSATEGHICAFRFPDPDNAGYQEYQACGCWLAQDSGELAWNCYEEGSGPPCPAAQPEDGAGCYGMRGQTCEYPARTACSCDGDGTAENTTWSCTDTLKVANSNEPAIDSSTPVNALTTDERHTWCQWYLDVVQGGPGFPEPTDEVDENGYVTNAACSGSGEPNFSGGMPILSTADCVGNLSLTSCEAPLEALNDCVRTFQNRLPSPRGCAPYLDAAGCSGTMVNAGTPGSGDGPLNSICWVKVR